MQSLPPLGSLLPSLPLVPFPPADSSPLVCVIGRARRLPRPPPTTKHCHRIAPPGDSPRRSALHFLDDTRLTAVRSRTSGLRTGLSPTAAPGTRRLEHGHHLLTARRRSPCSASTEVRLLIDPRPTWWRPRLTEPAPESTPEDSAPFHGLVDGRSRVSSSDRIAKILADPSVVGWPQIPELIGARRAAAATGRSVSTLPRPCAVGGFLFCGCCCCPSFPLRLKAASRSQRVGCLP